MDAPTADGFRVAFPVFAAEAAYPAGEVDFWMTVGALMVNADRWGDLTALGVYLFTAHNLTLEQIARREGRNGNPGGRATGPVSSKSVDKVSVAYDTASASLADAGAWNLTTYGTRFYQLRQMMGLGGIQINTPGQGPQFGYPGTGAWPGVIPGYW